jgi:hypothetical protein
VIALDGIHELSRDLHRSTVSDRSNDFSGKYKSGRPEDSGRGTFGNSPGGNG